MTTQLNSESRDYSLSRHFVSVAQQLLSYPTFCETQVQSDFQLTRYAARKLFAELRAHALITKIPQSKTIHGYFTPAYFQWTITNPKFTVGEANNNNNKVSVVDRRASLGRDRAISFEEFARQSGRSTAGEPRANFDTVTNTVNAVASLHLSPTEQLYYDWLQEDTQHEFSDAIVVMLLQEHMKIHQEARPNIQRCHAYILYTQHKAQTPRLSYLINIFLKRKEGRNWGEFNTSDSIFQLCIKHVYGNPCVASPLTPQPTISKNEYQPTDKSPQTIVEPPTLSRVGTSREVAALNNLSPEERALCDEQAELVNLKTAVDKIVDRARTAKERDLPKSSLQADADRVFATFDANVSSPSLTAMQKVAELRDAVTTALLKLEDAIEQHEQPKATIQEVMTQPPVKRDLPPAQTKHLIASAKHVESVSLDEQRARLAAQKALLLSGKNTADAKKS